MSGWGRLKVGLRADLTVLDHESKVVQVTVVRVDVAGRAVWHPAVWPHAALEVSL